MSLVAENLLRLKCGLTAEVSDSDRMLWLQKEGAHITAGITLDSTSDLMFDEADGEISLLVAGTIYISMAATKDQAESLGKMLGADFTFVEKLDPQAESELADLVRSELEKDRMKSFSFPE